MSVNADGKGYTCVFILGFLVNTFKLTRKLVCDYEEIWCSIPAPPLGDLRFPGELRVEFVGKGKNLIIVNLIMMKNLAILCGRRVELAIQ